MIYISGHHELYDGKKWRRCAVAAPWPAGCGWLRPNKPCGVLFYNRSNTTVHTFYEYFCERLGREDLIFHLLYDCQNKPRTKNWWLPQDTATWRTPKALNDFSLAQNRPEQASSLEEHHTNMLSVGIIGAAPTSHRVVINISKSKVDCAPAVCILVSFWNY